MIISILLAIVLGMGTILLGQLKVIKGMENSIMAFYAADTGIERVLIDRNSPFNISETILPNGAKYEVFVYKGREILGGPEGNCTGAGLHYCIKSVGVYKETRRAIEVAY